MGTVAIGVNTYKVNSRSPGPAAATSQLIHEPDHNNKAQPGRVALIDGPDLIEDSITIQAVDTSATAPARGDAMTDDYDESGTASTFRVMDVTRDRNKGAPNTWTVTRFLETYQG